MKKFVLLVASILATLHSIASRSSNDSNNQLILASSDGIYNHGSHASHCSHASHYSAVINNSPVIKQTSYSTRVELDSFDELSEKQKIKQTSYSTKVELDSLNELSEKQKMYVNENVSCDGNGKIENVHLKVAYYAYVSSVKTLDRSIVKVEKHFPEKSKSIYLEFSNGSWYVIPLSGEYFIYGNNIDFISVPKSVWATELIKIR